MIATTHTPKGGFGGHLLRRLTHIASILIPLFYYYYEQLLTPLSQILDVNQLILIILIVIMILESLRLHNGWTLIGQRAYENHHISGFAWSLCTSFLVVLTAGSLPLGFAIIVAYAIGDPLIGELRQRQISTFKVVFISLTAIAIVWLSFVYSFHLSWWLVLIIPPITVAAEWPQLRWIDDNALMQLVPLLVVWILRIL